MTPIFNITQLTAGENNFIAEITFNPDHPVFAGHFPGQPVVPGVVLVEISAAVASRITGKELVVTEGSNLKFLQMIDPVKNPVIWLDGSIVEEGQDSYKAGFRFYSGEVDFAKFRGIRLEVKEP